MVALARIHAPVFGDLALAATDWLNQPTPLNRALLTVLLPGFLERYRDRIVDLLAAVLPHVGDQDPLAVDREPKRVAKAAGVDLVAPALADVGVRAWDPVGAVLSLARVDPNQLSEEGALPRRSGCRSARRAGGGIQQAVAGDHHGAAAVVN
jgi:hypothetical protein